MHTATASAPPQTSVSLLAPLSGSLFAIEHVPDPVFAQKMVGDGIAIDPTSQSLLAPCDGEIIQLHPSHHAVTLRTLQGLEVLMHIGLDTVALRGKGFTPHVKVGDRVKTGEALIDFDADYIALHAKSLLTEMVITNGDRVQTLIGRSGSVTVGEDIILEVTLAGAVDAETATPVGEQTTSAPIVIPNPIGLHARPAAVLANLAKHYQAKIQLHRGNDSANVRSVIALMNLQVVQKETVTLTAIGADAKAAVLALTDAIARGLGEDVSVPAVAPLKPAQSQQSQPLRPRSTDANLLLGVSASPGLAVGQTYRVREDVLSIVETAQNPVAEKQQLDAAIAQAMLEVEAVRAKVEEQGKPDKAAIFAAHRELLADPELLDVAHSYLDQGKSAAFAWKQAFTAQAEQLARLPNALFAQRANDLRDVGQRVLRLLVGATATAASYPPNTILLAEDLTPSDMATLDREVVKGFCTLAGGATSHVAILARSMGVPAIVGAEPRLLELPDGSSVILDGSQGTLRLHATPDELERVQQRIAQQQARQTTDRQYATYPAVTIDGYRVEVVANIGSLNDAKESVALGGEGVGLLRTEVMFMARALAPSEEEQTTLYRSILQVLGRDRSLIVRTLDVGGDKPLSYLPMPHEENPFLGERGIRMAFDQPDMLRTQLRALLRASGAGTLRVMFPMIGRLEEIQMAKAILEEERQRLGIAPIAVGIMIEVPSAAVMAEQFAKEVDFFSIGTNDLTQYTLAMDRGHPKLAPYVDSLHPAVLQLIAQTVKGASQHGKWVGVCGGSASDPQAVPLLLGLGVKELSVSIATIPSIKAQIRTLNFAHCQTLAKQALTLSTAAAVRALCPLVDE
ncbi:phosphoenolpyruvate--protein phosphotransferase [Stenomitos frigidus]|uniref:Phosphocarrier protein HPr n=1 Tax=Stenomitos frigidus ULC18 TaxID=2107698 RepID=A0A2T1EBC4_9CYAN|nr:phosphoenolpyruvate--protein phosphotransferase [Stenomitos frigidus]PSB30062.1 phosphoenolpyruvate--protein phosphotransferase [Stenomitos frigidus ULC18]